MSEQKRAAINLDEIDEERLRQISAADFLEALNSSTMSTITAARVLRFFPEKKKYELEKWEPEKWTPEKQWPEFNEKKKVELEPHPLFTGQFPVDDLRTRLARIEVQLERLAKR
jgi:hypothetical protein